MSFGKYKGIEIGMIYLCDPKYLEWALINTDLAVPDIEYLRKLKVLHNFHNLDIGQRVEISNIGIDVFLGDNYFKWLSFKDVQFSGRYAFQFSSLALQKNEQKCTFLRRDVGIPPINESDITYFYIYLEERDSKSFIKVQSYTCIELKETTKGMKYYIIEFDNKNWAFPHLPRIENCKIGLRKTEALNVPIGAKFKVHFSEQKFAIDILE